MKINAGYILRLSPLFSSSAYPFPKILLTLMVMTSSNWNALQEAAQ
jgi:hypothetical protein